MRVLIYHDDAEQWRNILLERLPDAEIHVAADSGNPQVDYLVAWKPPASVFDEQTALQGIVNLGAGVDALLQNPSRPREIPIVKLRDAGMGELIGDYARYGVLHFQRDFDRYRRQQANSEWREVPVVDKPDWPVGVLGLGAIGTRVAQMLAADGYPIHGWSRSPKQIEGIACHHGDRGLDTLLRQVKTLITLLPDTPATRHIIDRDNLAKLPAGASLINPGRGTLIDEPALLDALGEEESEGRLRGALLDAFPSEPLAADSPLWRHPRILITPHMAGPTPIGAAADQVADALDAMSKGKAVETVDPDAGY
ncbi:MAG: glyoxylate/hydroxypyruvate reductase A [Salinicola sp.]|uniref:2-hydroxyacid dehydrogenase n=1 Tax=uncultured Salinicola sp. TaxID=1193542 RepID=UPI000C918A7C|nr:glyoxylate/hydroxypyruvate reductase A [uncultured Salinicola sp.]MAM59092.1 glyoxylate/hydroxypyruvate reductase A [Salinicola sp.]|tara:strand:- start:959 stop:1888 length:930 start_codon:yes stop_codon:yes gene_type:complete